MASAASVAGAIMLLAGVGSAHGDDPLTRPIAPESAKRWLGPQVPTRIYGNSYLVGFADLNVALIRTSAGLVLIDAGVPQGVAAVEANIRRLGFRVKDVKYILSTEPHFDHAGGLAALARDSGATVVASVAAAAALRRGTIGPDDPQFGLVVDFPGVTRVRAVADGEKLTLGNTVITAIATPGHTAGSMSWTWRSCERRKCLNMVFGSSLNPASADDYRYTDPAHAFVIAGFRRSFAVMRKLPCDILFSAHPSQSGGDEKFTALRKRPVPNPFIDRGACRTVATKFETLLNARIAKEGVR
ncbi:subclass B3 metallo-beta-lactamase [Sphingomonas sp. So64.6b]|nr:subclass B3 metallo-beta-lactamase [Sphingomonas sp. So64.6b]